MTSSLKGLECLTCSAKMSPLNAVMGYGFSGYVYECPKCKVNIMVRVRPNHDTDDKGGQCTIRDDSDGKGSDVLGHRLWDGTPKVIYRDPER